MQKLREVYCMLSKDVVGMNLEILLQNNTSGNYENNDSELL